MKVSFVFRKLLVVVTLLGTAAIVRAQTNDSFAGRLALTGSAPSAVSNNLSATREPGEPNHGAGGGARSLWWTWTAPTSGLVNFSAYAGGALPVGFYPFSTMLPRTLAVYTGDSAASLSEVASINAPDTAGDGFFYNPWESGVSAGPSFNVQVTAGTVYQIAVSVPSNNGFLNTPDDGTVVLTINAVPCIYSSAGARTTVGGSFSYPILASNNPTSYQATNLPVGLSLNPYTGAISGKLSSAGTYAIGLAATNPGGTGTATLTLEVDPPGPAAAITAPVISSAATASGNVGTAFSYSIYGSGASSSYDAAGLPPGLSIDKTSGSITGTPTAAGDYAVTVSATSAAGTGSASVLFRLAAAPHAPVITSNLAVSGTVGSSIYYSVSTADYSNPPTGYTASNLPPGLGFDTAAGTLRGTPTTSGVYPVALTAVNAGGTGSAVVTVTVLFPSSGGLPSPAAPMLGSSATAAATTGAAFSYQLAASNAPTSFTANNLPAGVSLNSQNGYLTGTPIMPGVSLVLVSASNPYGTSNGLLTITVADATTATPSGPPPTVTSAAEVSTSVGGYVYYQITTTYGNPPFNNYYYGYSSSATVGVSGLPPGLSFNATYGQITGSPTKTGTYAARINVTVPNSTYPYSQQYVTGTAVVTFVVNNAVPASTPTVPVFSSAASIAGVQGAPFSGYTASATGIPSAYTASGLPAGLSFDPASHSVSGTPTVAGTYQASFTAANSAGTGTGVVTFVIAATASPTALPIINSSATATGTIGNSFSYSISASNSPTNYAVSGLPAGLSLNTSTGSISGTPAASGVFTVPISATNASGTASATLTITIAANPGLPLITSSATARATVGASFSYNIYASNSPTAYTVGTLPGGLTFNASSGAISGTPTSAGVYTVPMTAANATGTASATLTITVAAPAPPAFFSNAAANCTVGVSFNYSISASNSPTSYAANGLPAGLSLNTSTGSISGTSTMAGVYPVTISATNSGGTASATLTITVATASPLQAPVISSAASATGIVGAAFSYAITATNSPTSYDLGASLPPGLSFNPQTGLLAGKPTAASTYTIPIYAANSAGNASAVVTLVFTAQSSARPVITSPATLNIFANQALNLPLGASNAPTSFTASNLPPGVSLNASTGVLSGTPYYSGSAQPYAVAVSATNAVGTGTATLTIRVNAALPPYVTSAMSVGGVRGTALSYALTATGTVYSYSVSNLPSGLSCNPGTGQITGVPTTAGTYTASVQVSTSGGTATAKITFLIASAVTNAPVPSTSAGALVHVGDTFSYPLAASNSASAFSVSGLPYGLSYNATTKTIVGVPASTGTSSVTVTAFNSSGTGSGVLNLVVVSALPPGVTSQAEVGGMVGTAFNYGVTVGAGATAYNYIASNLAPGLILDPSTGQISGTPTVAGVFAVPLTVYTYAGYLTGNLTITIDDLPTAPPVFTGAAERTGTVGAPLTFALGASNQPTAFMATNLPAGLTLDGTVGTISGVPTTAGTFTVPVSATNAVGTSTATLTLSIAAMPPAPPDLTANNLAVALTVGDSGVLYQVRAANGPVSFAVSSLPSGLSLDPASGTVSGIASTAGTYATTVAATNAAGTSSAVVTFNVAAGRAPVFSSISANLTGNVGSSFSNSVYANASPGLSYLANGLPPGVYLDSSSGQFFGSPLAAGTYVATVSAANAFGTDTASVVFVVAGASVPTFYSSNAEQTASIGGSVYSSYSALNATRFTLSGLPPGLSYNFSSGSDVTVRGTPTVAGTYPVTITASSAAGSANEVVTFVVAAPVVTVPSITSAAGAGGSVNAAFGYQISATNSPTAYTVGGLPNGLQVNTTTGYISGTPATAGSYPVAVTATNAGGTANAVVTLQIDTSPAPAPVLPVIYSAAAASYGDDSSDPFEYLFDPQANQFSYTISASGLPASFAATGLPKGLSLNAATGVISGVPEAAGTFLVPISATNAAGTGSAVLTIVAPLMTSMLSAALTTSGAVGSQFSYTIYAADPGESYGSYAQEDEFYGSALDPDAPAYAAMGLPPGLSLNRTSGQITGTPTQAGSFPVTLSATNRAGVVSAVVTFAIAATSPPVATAAPTISANATALGFTGAPFSFYLNGSGPSYSASGLPGGLSLNPSSGQITGTPTAAGTYQVSVNCMNAASTASAVLTIVVLTSPDAPVINSSAGAVATVGSSFGYSVSASTSTFVPGQISYLAENVPPGLSFNASSGYLSGSPTQTGIFAVPITAACVGVATRGTLMLTVQPAPATAPAVALPLLGGPAGATGFLGNPFLYSYGLAGFTPDGALPAGLSYNSATGAITGIPATAGSFDVALSASDASGTGHAELNLRIIAPNLSLPRIIIQPVGGFATQGAPVALSATATGAPTPTYRWLHDGATVLGATATTLNLMVAQPADAGTYTLTAINSSGTTSSTTVTLLVLQSFADWQSTYFSAQEIAAGLAAPGYDFDGDGWANLLDYAFGRNPRTGVGGSTPDVSKLPGGPLVIQFDRDAGKTDLTYVIEASPDLLNWTAIAQSSAGAATVNLGGAGTITENSVGGEIMTVTVQDGTLPNASGARFLRLRVTEP